MVVCNLPEAENRESPIWFFVEVLLLAGFFFLVAGGQPPDVNEAHYLTKAKHYWDASFAPQDVFLNSTDAHVVFYWSVGWITKFCSLTTTAWIGRWICWLFLASGFMSISRSLGHRRGLGIISGVLFFVLQTNFHLAGEWVVGGLEAKVFAFGFCFLSFSYAIRKKWNVVWMLLGFAIAFHVLVGGWITLLIALVRIRELIRTRSLNEYELLAGGFGLCVGLIGLVPAWGLGGTADGLVTRRANYISVHVRLSHHLLFSSFQIERLIRFGVLCGIWFLLWWRAGRDLVSNMSILFQIAVFSVGLCGVGILLDVGFSEMSDLQNSLLRYYWFRTSDVLVPLAVAFTAVSVGTAMAKRNGATAKIIMMSMVIIVVCPVWNFQKTLFRDPRPRGDVMALPHSTHTEPNHRRETTLRIERHFLACCQWIRRHAPRNAIVITPVRQQTFKWNAERAEVVTRKDMPQDPDGLVQWYNRRESLYPVRDGRRGLRQLSNDEIASLADTFDANFLLIPQFSAEGQTRFDGDLRFVRHFPADNDHSYYAVYEVVHE
ncbi:MAG: DUF6798 domain-containing protein [Pirellulales bacterium]|jgi:hypothetical protein